MRSSCRQRLGLFTALLLIVFTSIERVFATDSLDDYAPGAFVSGIGHSGVVGVYDPSALYWNPAALAVRHYHQGTLSVHEPYHINYLGYSYFSPSSGSFALSYGSSSAAATALQWGAVGWGYKLAPGFYGGVSASYLQQGSMAWGTLGAALLFRPTISKLRPAKQGSFFQSPYIMDRLTVGVVIQNLPLGKSEYDHQIRLGAAYKFLQSGPSLIYAHHFMPKQDTDHIGLLITPISSVQIYAGFKNFDAAMFTFGAGFQWENIDLQLAYDRTTKRLVFSTGIRIGKHPTRIASDYYERAVKAVRQKDKRAALKFCQYSLIYDENFQESAELRKLLLPIIAEENVTIDSLQNAALAFQNQGRYLDAAVQYLKILKIDPDNAEARAAIAMIRPKVNVDAERWYLQAVELYEKGEINKADELFESIALVRPDHFGAKRYIKKIDIFRQKQAEQHYFAGLGYYSQHKLDLADAEFRKALEIAPNYEDASQYLARISQTRAQNRNKIRDLLSQARENEDNGAYKNALTLYEEILRIQPDHSTALSRVPVVKNHLKRAAERYYARGLSSFNSGDMDNAERYFRLALSMQADHQGARRYLRQISSSTTDKTAAILQEAREALDKSDWQNAIAAADSVLAQDPNNAAADSLKKAALDAMKATALLANARHLYNAGKYVEAMEQLDKILKDAPSYIDAQNLLQDCQKKLYDRVDDYYSLGIELYTKEQYLEAIRMWDIVLRINPYHKGALDYKKQAQERMEALQSLP